MEMLASIVASRVLPGLVTIKVILTYRRHCFLSLVYLVGLTHPDRLGLNSPEFPTWYNDPDWVLLLPCDDGCFWLHYFVATRNWLCLSHWEEQRIFGENVLQGQPADAVGPTGQTNKFLKHPLVDTDFPQGPFVLAATKEMKPNFHASIWNASSCFKNSLSEMKGKHLVSSKCCYEVDRISFHWQNRSFGIAH